MLCVYVVIVLPGQTACNRVVYGGCGVGPGGQMAKESLRRGEAPRSKIGSIDVHTGNQVLRAHVHTRNRCACYVYNNKERISFDLRLWMVEAPPPKRRKKERKTTTTKEKKNLGVKIQCN